MTVKEQYTHKKFFSWFECWHPAKYAALKAEQEYNSAVIAANAEQDRLEAEMSLLLTQLDNQKIIIAIIIVAITIIITY